MTTPTRSRAAGTRWLHTALDDAVLAVFRRLGSPIDDDELQRSCDEAAVALELHAAAGHLSDPTAAHPAPPAPTDTQWKDRRAGNIRFKHITFSSAYDPQPVDPAVGRWKGFEANRTMHLWALRHRTPRPWLVCIHGTGMGRARLDLGFFRALWLFTKLGVNVALPVLPLHGPRSDDDGAAAYPSEDVLHNMHGSRQAVWDVRRTIAMLRELDDGPVGVHGISLGGYIGALLAGLDDELACVIVGAPAVDLGELIAQHRPGPRSPTDDALSAVAADLAPVVAPLAMPVLVPRERRFLYVGSVDKMVDPDTHGRRLYEHWDRPETLWYDGGHTGLAFHRPIGRFTASALRAAGLAYADERATDVGALAAEPLDAVETPT